MNALTPSSTLERRRVIYWDNLPRLLHEGLLLELSDAHLVSLGIIRQVYTKGHPWRRLHRRRQGLKGGQIVFIHTASEASMSSREPWMRDTL